MKLGEARGHYYELSGLASSSARQLAFAGIAVIWILATDNRVIEVPAVELRTPLFVFVSALALDLLQYYSGAAFWGAFSRLKEKHQQTKKKKKGKYKNAPAWSNWVPLFSFWVKGIAVAWGYILLVEILWPVLFASSGVVVAEPAIQ